MEREKENGGKERKRDKMKEDSRSPIKEKPCVSDGEKEEERKKEKRASSHNGDDDDHHLHSFFTSSFHLLMRYMVNLKKILQIREILGMERFGTAVLGFTILFIFCDAVKKIIIHKAV